MPAGGHEHRRRPRTAKESAKPAEVVFVVKGDHVEAVPVKIGICDDNYWEITDGLTNGAGNCLRRLPRHQPRSRGRLEDQKRGSRRGMPKP